MKLITIVLAVLTLNGCANRKLEHAYLLGVWKSNEAMTLQSMHSTPKVTEKAKKLFEKDFFGKLVVEYKQSEFRASLTGDWSDSEYHP